MPDDDQRHEPEDVDDEHAAVHGERGALCAGAQYSRSSGDEAGVAGGILSSINMSFCEYLLYSFDVKFEGKL